jgi:hypothetical protein
MDSPGGDRLTRLRALIARLERLPASAESDWMLREARARMVDVETGERTARMRPREVDPPPPEAPRRRRDVAVKRPAAPRAAAPARTEAAAEQPLSIVPEPPVDASAAPIGTDGLLWLDDPARQADVSPAGDDGDLRPWRRGLRG